MGGYGAGLISGALVGALAAMAAQWAFSQPRDRSIIHACVEWRQMGEPQIISNGERRCERWSDGKIRLEVNRQ